MAEDKEGVGMSLMRAEASERAVIGAALLVGSSAVYEVESCGIEPKHFKIPSLRKTWEIILKEVGVGSHPDAGLIAEKYPSEVQSIGGLSFLCSLPGACGSLTLIPQYANQMLEANRKDALVLAARRVLQESSIDAPSSDDLQAILEEALRDSAEGLGVKDELETAENIIREWSNTRAQVLAGEIEDTDLKWNLTAMDRFVTAGPGHLVVIGGRPKMGKTQLAISLMANLAGSAGPTLFCSAEMGKEALARRILSSTMDIKTRNLQKFTLGFDDTIKSWAGVPLMFDYRARSVRSVITSVRQAKRTHGIRAAAIDYLQLLEMDGSRTEEEEIGRASKAFKGLAEELEIPILLLVQVNRKCEERSDKRPVMSDIRGSGRVEQDADAVVFVYREVCYNERFPRPNQVELIVRANRHGPAGTGMSYWTPGSGWFTDPVPWDLSE